MVLPSGALAEKSIYLQSWQHISTLTHRNYTLAAGQWLSYYDAIHHNHTSLCVLCANLPRYLYVKFKINAIWLGARLGDMLNVKF